MIKYKHIKSGDIYTVINNTIINTTNANDGELMVLYHNKDGKLFVREIIEFHEKFNQFNN
jgi:hypothetical protein